TRSLITEEERRAYGEEALSVMERAALGAVGGTIEQLDLQNRRLSSELQAVKQREVLDYLDRRYGEQWRQTNKNDPRWLNWLAGQHEYAPVTRQQLVNSAMQAGDAQRVAAILDGYYSETSGTHPQARSTRSTPSRSYGQPTISAKQVENFY